MARQRGTKRPPFGLPVGIVLTAMPDGRRHTVRTGDGGMVCGRLAGVPSGAAAEEAQAAAAAMPVACARDLHGVGVEVTWDASPEPGSRTGQVTPLAAEPRPGSRSAFGA
ncbi:hypothetical protein [Streptomyces griseochromogenes]|uniref:hypothetical protein n=1 Tax=Streptomyces griseochromogenes TaxID=68214 RepID=UPI0037B287A3